LYFAKGFVTIGTIVDTEGNNEMGSMASGSTVSTIATLNDIPKGKALRIKAFSMEFPVELVCVDRLITK